MAGAGDQVGKVHCVLGSGSEDREEFFSLYRLDGHEELGRPFEYKATLLALEEDDFELKDLLGTSMTFEIALRDGDVRYFNAQVSQIMYSGSHGRFVEYRATLRPWLWFLNHHSDNRVFQELSVPDIIKQVFQEHGGPVKDSLTGNHPVREYCVQYGESDFNFMSRLMEEEGIYYYFEHTNGKHELVLVDADSSHGPFAGYDTILYYPPGDDSAHKEDHISHWESRFQVDSGTAIAQSYNYEAPSTDLEGRSTIDRAHDLSKGELYEYGKLYDTAAKGEAAAKTRIEERQSSHHVVTGGGNVRGVCSGYTFDLERMPLEDQNGKYLITGTDFEFQNNELTGGGGGDTYFECVFQAIPEKTPFRTACITPKATVRGPQTAVVVGPKGDDIFTDSLGRVKVQFHWDREGQLNENSSCMVRVSTAIAGSSWGMVSIPRIGQEVIVDFLEGDPDQPIIVGSVYNEEKKVPYKLPDNMTQSGFKSRSTDGTKDSGEPSNFNEIRFEDKKDDEEIFIQAERNFKRVVKNDDVLEVGLQSDDVKNGVGDQTIEIHNNRTVTLKDGKEGNDKLTIEKGDRTTKIEKGSDDLYAKKKITIEAGDLFEVKVGKAKLTMKKTGEITIEGMNVSIKDKGKTNIDAKMDVGIKGGMNTKVEGGLNIELKGGVGAKVDGGVNLDLKGAAMAKLKGGVTMIG